MEKSLYYQPSLDLSEETRSDLTGVEAVRKRSPSQKRKRSREGCRGKPQETVEKPGVCKEPEVEKVESPTPLPVEKKQEEVAEVKPEISNLLPWLKSLFIREKSARRVHQQHRVSGNRDRLRAAERRRSCRKATSFMCQSCSKPIAVGKYTVFRAGEEIRHPVTEKKDWEKV